MDAAEKSRMVTGDLSNSEALVLSDFLSRFKLSAALTIEHPAEERVLERVRATM